MSKLYEPKAKGVEWDFIILLPCLFVESLLIKSQVFFEENFKKSDLIF